MIESYYRAFAHAHGSHREQITDDRATTRRYLVWLRDRWNEFYVLHPQCFEAKSPRPPQRPNPTEKGRAAFEQWLGEKYPKPLGAA